ncbi:MAG: hypothetical protein WBN34_15015, partial [Woeseia sp.]
MNRIAAFLLIILALAVPQSGSAEVYDLPADGSDVIGAISTIKARADDTLVDIARRHGLGYE